MAGRAAGRQPQNERGESPEPTYRILGVLHVRIGVHARPPKDRVGVEAVVLWARWTRGAGSSDRPSPQSSRSRGGGASPKLDDEKDDSPPMLAESPVRPADRLVGPSTWPTRAAGRPTTKRTGHREEERGKSPATYRRNTIVLLHVRIGVHTRVPKDRVGVEAVVVLWARWTRGAGSSDRLGGPSAWPTRAAGRPTTN